MKTGLAGLVFLWALPHVLAAAHPEKLALHARMDVEAGPEVGRLMEGSAATGRGSVARMSWRTYEEQPRTYVAHWPIRHTGWSEVALSIVPQSNGVVSVDILGPWERDSAAQAIYKQEVLWDALTATGAALNNGSFEEMSEGAPAGWRNPWGGAVAFDPETPPVDGLNVVRVWHDHRLRTVLTVTGGVPVEIRAWVRAGIPAGFVDNPRILDSNTPAHRAVRGFRRGINFSNAFDGPAGENWGGGPLGPADYDAVKAEGFDHVRLPVRWNAHTGPGPEHAISNAFFAEVDAVVDGLLERDINVLLNVHGFDEFCADSEAWTPKLIAIWDQLGAHYRNRSARLAFEIINEPYGTATTEVMNGIYARLLPRLRTTNPGRTIFVGPGGWNGISELPALRLPANDSNLVVTVHIYEPFLFTHQGASWVGAMAATTNVVYPGPPPAPVPVHPDARWNSGVVEWFAAYNKQPTASNPCSRQTFEAALESARQWSDHYGRPVHVGEFGVFTTADPASRARYYREVIAALDRLGLGWAAWDWKSGFRYWNRETGAPEPGMREAFFPRAGRGR